MLHSTSSSTWSRHLRTVATSCFESPVFLNGKNADIRRATLPGLSSALAFSRTPLLFLILLRPLKVEVHREVFDKSLACIQAGCKLVNLNSLWCECIPWCFSGWTLPLNKCNWDKSRFAAKVGTSTSITFILKPVMPLIINLWLLKTVSLRNLLVHLVCLTCGGTSSAQPQP